MSPSDTRNRAMLRLISDFSQEASKISKKLIEDLPIPAEERKLKAREIEGKPFHYIYVKSI